MKKILDWNSYIDKAVQMVSEGIVMLKNNNNALPIDKNKEIAVFGRIQLNYYKSGTGSGGMVNVSKVTGVIEGLTECGAKLNEDLLAVYRAWEQKHPFDLGEGWGKEPWSQEEMPLDEELVKNTAVKAETALILIGRTAGEEQDNRLNEGSYLLSEAEKNMITLVKKHFRKTVILLNVGNIIDMNFIEESGVDAVLYIWQGGMVGGKGTAEVLTGKVSPSGKLPDTIAYNVSDYPSADNFGDLKRNFYAEDIYVGYRYFETFARDRVLYPFGYGISYTDFTVNVISVSENDENFEFDIEVKNTGSVYSGKETVQIYCSAPQGKLGKPARVLCGYKKTDIIEPGNTQCFTVSVSKNSLASYDDSGVTGNRFCFVLETGKYDFYVGSDVRSAKLTASFEMSEKVVLQCTQALAPVMAFERIVPVVNENGEYTKSFESVPLLEIDEEKRRIENIPEEILYTGDKGIKLSDVAEGKNTMEEFIAQLSDYDLSCIIRGEGMGSPRVTTGTASAFGGVSDNLSAFGIPAGCCADGPSGMRLDCGTKAFSLPNGTMIASAFNRQLAEELFEFTGMEMAVNKVDCLLGPGMNIHRHPLNGRNFEYFSEDPFLTGTMAAAELKGLHKNGVTGTVKHFCANNQETSRHFSDSVISERALREIYLKSFEIAVKEGNADSIMTTYGLVNGLWTAGNYDLNTTILRNEWGFTGFTMTDWWPNINERANPENFNKTNFAAMARAQNDIYMVCSDGSSNDDNTLEALENGTLERAELQRNASNICRFMLNTNALRRLNGKYEPVEIINREDSNSENDEPVVFYKMEGEEYTLNTEDICTDKGSSYCYTMENKMPGYYTITLTASSDQSELAQIPVTVFSIGTAVASFTWNGTGGKKVSFSKDIPMFSRFNTVRIYFAQSGLKLHSIHYKYSKGRN